MAQGQAGQGCGRAADQHPPASLGQELMAPSWSETGSLATGRVARGGGKGQ